MLYYCSVGTHSYVWYQNYYYFKLFDDHLLNNQNFCLGILNAKMIGSYLIIIIILICDT